MENEKLQWQHLNREIKVLKSVSLHRAEAENPQGKMSLQSLITQHVINNNNDGLSVKFQPP